VVQVIVSPRHPQGPVALDIPVDPALLAAGHHNGSTFHRHQKFAALVRDGGRPDVGLHDGWWAAAMGMAAQQSARSGQAVDLVSYAPPEA
jgi:hypothetical protein